MDMVMEGKKLAMGEKNQGNKGNKGKGNAHIKDNPLKRDF
jgi:hypothetical protein